MEKSTKKFAIGTFFAAMIGFITGILTAPKSGKETRADIKQATQNTLTEAERQLKKLHTQLATLLNQARDKANAIEGKAKKELDDVIEKTNAVKEKARQLLSAAHEGDADDKELKKAISEATKSIEHLKAFLGKSD